MPPTKAIPESYPGFAVFKTFRKQLMLAKFSKIDHSRKFMSAKFSKTDDEKKPELKNLSDFPLFHNF